MQRLSKFWPFAVWLLIFYATWLTIVIVGDHWSTVGSHWPIAVAMAIGSYFAGSTPVGGGAVGFPVLVLLFDHPGSLGRNFGLAVQSIGMVSATIYIACSRVRLDWGLLRPALVGSLIGTVAGAALVAPLVPDLWVKLLFAVVWAGFGVMHLIRLRELVAAEGSSQRWRRHDRSIGLTMGLAGGIVASITGVGTDMILYAALVLLYRSDLKVAIPTSVVLMAFTSLVGLSANLLLAAADPVQYQVQGEVFANWLAAAPVVALGAPLGALVINLISRTPTLVIVSVLCIGQFAWTMLHERVTGLPLIVALASVVALIGLFQVLYQFGSEQN